VFSNISHCNHLSLHHTMPKTRSGYVAWHCLFPDEHTHHRPVLLHRVSVGTIHALSSKIKATAIVGPVRVAGNAFNYHTMMLSLQQSPSSSPSSSSSSLPLRWWCGRRRRRRRLYRRRRFCHRHRCRRRCHCRCHRCFGDHNKRTNERTNERTSLRESVSE